jgi:hypothetical protein
MYETRIRTLPVTLDKVEGKASLDETDLWIRKRGEMTCETNNETVVETLNETDEKRNEKDTLGPVISSESLIVTLAPPIPFTSPKVKPRYCYCHCLQSGWGWQMSLRNDLQGNFAIGTPGGD